MSTPKMVYFLFIFYFFLFSIYKEGKT